MPIPFCLPNAHSPVYLYPFGLVFQCDLGEALFVRTYHIYVPWPCFLSLRCSPSKRRPSGQTIFPKPWNWLSAHMPTYVRLSCHEKVPRPNPKYSWLILLLTLAFNIIGNEVTVVSVPICPLKRANAFFESLPKISFKSVPVWPALEASAAL